MNTNIHIGNSIRKELEIQKRSVKWLADEMECDASNLRKKINKPHISPELLLNISKVLGVDFFIFYSQSISKNNE